MIYINASYLELLFKLVNKQLPIYFNQLLFHLITSCTTMRQEDVNELLFQELITSSQKETRYIAAVTYNSTPVSVTAKIYSHSLVGFSTYINNQTNEHYNNWCTIEHCYSCRQR